jgi:hypothetical protein
MWVDVQGPRKGRGVVGVFEICEVFWDVPVLSACQRKKVIAVSGRY